MSYQYYGCYWVIRSHTNYSKIVNTVQELGGQLVQLRPGGISHEGYEYIRFSMKVNTAAVLDEFVHKIGQEYGLVNWYKVSEKYFSEGIPFFDIQDVVYLLFVSRWLDGMNNIGKRTRQSERNSIVKIPLSPAWGCG